MSVVRFFAAAEEAAGTAEEQRTEASLDALRAGLVADHPLLAPILPRCAVLVDGTRRDDDVAIPEGATVDVLPPFAGG
ncbi:MoaD/ThiS family protein [Microbacterium indicum]|uniref:MoaD/ThiS family protein n=1 Tax=Microbacterium indicum TaxID=358100 RepID=UPI0003F6F711|nr:MoaD/ThiS family protein [Microbacterium indicum]